MAYVCRCPSNHIAEIVMRPLLVDVTSGRALRPATDDEIARYAAGGTFLCERGRWVALAHSGAGESEDVRTIAEDDPALLAFLNSNTGGVK